MQMQFSCNSSDGILVAVTPLALQRRGFHANLPMPMYLSVVTRQLESKLPFQLGK